MSVMLYKYPGKHKLHGDNFDYTVVNEDEVQDAINSGWHKTTTEAKEAGVDADIERKRIEVVATELGISFDGRTSTEKLKSKINDKRNKTTTVGII